MTETTQTPQTTAPSAATAPATANAGRYSLTDDGQVMFQPDSTNPLPGAPVGKLLKGDSLLQPKSDHAPAQEWLDIHVRAVLEPLFLLKQEAGEGALPEGPARDIGARLYESLGVMHRADLEDLISGLDAETRKPLRAKGVRLGPILVFLPALVKPAAVKMRALLWGVWNDKALPVVRPADGRVSEVVDPQSIDRNFYRMIGYPVFARRAIRIDMLDRVLTDVYDTAKNGIFDAKHKYAEWLGCNLDDLHAVLESMGHRRLKEAAEKEAVAEGDATSVAEGDATSLAEGDPRPVAESDPRREERPFSEPQEKPFDEPSERPVEAPREDPIPQQQPELPATPVETPAPSVPAEIPLGSAVADVVANARPSPVLVKFVLKRGKMSDRPAARARNQRREKTALKQSGGKQSGGKKQNGPKFDPNTPQLLTEEDKARIEARKKEREQSREQKSRPDHARSDKPRRDDRDDRPRKPKFDRDSKDGRDDRSNEGRVYTFEGKKSAGDDDGNPFAILKNLKK